MEISKGLLETLKKISIVLKKNKIRFCLTGGLAVSIIARPRATEDIDILVILNEQNKNILKKILESNFVVIQANKNIMIFGKLKIWRIVLKDQYNKNGIVVLDIIFADNKILENAVKNSNILKLDGVEIPIIGAEDLILIKMVSDRLQDKIDVEAIINELKNKINKDYIKKNKGKL